jgi:hypothetical protein
LAKAVSEKDTSDSDTDFQPVIPKRTRKPKSKISDNQSECSNQSSQLFSNSGMVYQKIPSSVNKRENSSVVSDITTKSSSLHHSSTQIQTHQPSGVKRKECLNF